VASNRTTSGCSRSLWSLACSISAVLTTSTPCCCARTERRPSCTTRTSLTTRTRSVMTCFPFALSLLTWMHRGDCTTLELPNGECVHYFLIRRAHDYGETNESFVTMPRSVRAKPESPHDLPAPS